MKREEYTPDNYVDRNEQFQSKENIGEEETLREKQIRVFKLNTTRLLHERNKYVFLASIAEEAI